MSCFLLLFGETFEEQSGNGSNIPESASGNLSIVGAGVDVVG
jgi:hypothetical protein